AQARIPLAQIQARAAASRKSRSFQGRLAAKDGLHIIAEIKRASPSKGVIRPDLDPAAQARAYAAGGAAALSVLTDAKFFSGSAADLIAARKAVDLPVLRKDFTVSAYQIYESAALGADAILLIVRILTPDQLGHYLTICGELGLDALVEAHTAQEIDIALAAGAQVIGINNRDLTTFKTDLGLTIELAGRLPAHCTPMAESGIKTPADIQRLHSAGIRNFLIGESLVRADDPAGHLGALLGRAR
ncbi:MAG: indole-3-glycerol phosphate synthase TrpC, partial [Desulfobacterales bacterium]